MLIFLQEQFCQDIWSQIQQLWIFLYLLIKFASVHSIADVLVESIVALEVISDVAFCFL